MYRFSEPRPHPASSVCGTVFITHSEKFSPRRINEVGVYLQETFIRGNTVLESTLIIQLDIKRLQVGVYLMYIHGL